ncbi:MAG: 23S rRNA (guanosine(2251)-2'-O)-methyltransferase RlmB [Balneolaceae bacterium]
MSDEHNYIAGKNPLFETLEQRPGEIEKIFLRDGLRGRDVGRIQELASSHRIPVSRVPAARLRELTDERQDQGVVALVSPIHYLDLHDWLDEADVSANTSLLLLDEIEDPHNFGAILRSAAAAGITAVVVPKHRQAPVTSTVFKTSAGTAGRIPIIRAGNLNQAILELKEQGFWIAGLQAGSATPLWEMDVTVPLAFVIGSEGSGIRKKTLEHCDFHYAIPMHHGVESLNASVSAALVSYEWRRKQDTTT